MCVCVCVCVSVCVRERQRERERDYNDVCKAVHVCESVREGCCVSVRKRGVRFSGSSLTHFLSLYPRRRLSFSSEIISGPVTCREDKVDTKAHSHTHIYTYVRAYFRDLDLCVPNVMK